MTDVVAVGETPLRIAASGQDRFETAKSVDLVASGIESDVAIAAARLGADAAWYSKLPADPTGRRIASEIRQHGVTADPVYVEEGSVGTVVEEAGAQPRPATAIHDRADAAAASLDPGELPMDAIQSADVVFGSGSTMALSATAAETITAVLRAASGATTAFDLGYLPTLQSPSGARERVTQIADSVDVFCGTASDVRTVFDEDGQPQQLAHTLAAHHDFEMVVIRRSDGDAVIWDDGVIHDRSGLDTETVDASGDHTAFLGALLEELAEGASPEEALAWAVAAGSIARTIPGPLFTASRAEVAAVREELGADATAY